MNTRLSPRVQARAGQCTASADHPQWVGKWFFEVLVGFVDSITFQTVTEPESVGQFGPYDTEEAALKQSEEAVRMVSETYTKVVDGKASGIYHDMKDGGKIKPWKKS